MHENSQLVDAIEVFINKVERQINRQIKIIKSNRGGKYYKRYTENEQYLSPFAKFLERRGICAQYTMLDAPEQNDIAERLNHTLMNIIRIMLSDSSLPLSL